ncbi:MAG: riboflavin biosynthesis protein RibF [Tannerella sp.]|jgi:riboflavin kinase/FMN adenylyltransferase|nr:riboflavin biosynthesis protein RibF [Tannerella sp.]
MIITKRAEERQGKEWVATVGFFDGVHRGHRFLVEEMRRLADRKGLETAVITFPVHPRAVLQTDYKPGLLNSFDEKLAQLATTGVDYCAVLDFTTALASLSAEEFITKILYEQWHVRTLLVGYDHRFGHNRAEGFEQYVTYGAACGMEVVQASSYKMEDVAVSSSLIRQLLAKCRVQEAATLLTYPYRLKGHVVSGYGIGRTLGFPTANIEVNESSSKVRPGMGVYAVWVHLEGRRHKGMLTIGDRPTLYGTRVSIEVHLLHFSRDIYLQRIEVEFIRYLRENKKFDNLKALMAQLHEDYRQTDRILPEY